MSYLTNIEVRDRLLPSDNAYDVPTLDAAKQATYLPRPFHVWNAPKSEEINGGTIAFYTWDDKFLSTIKHPEKILNTGCAVMIEPNFTIMDTTPFPEALWSIYQKRRLARLCQEFDMQVVVDLFVPPRYAELNLLGVPQGWRAYSTRGTTRRLEELPDEYATACRHAGTEEILFVVYGGGEKVRAWCRTQPRVIFVPEVASKLRQHLEERHIQTAQGDHALYAWVEDAE